MTTKHTPGPWNTDCEICEITGSIAVWHNGPIVYVCDNTNGPENQKANARLIAAAPELLEACKAMFGLFKSHYSSSPEVTDALNSAKSAVSKAEGREG